jgi:hypothetical protein
VKYVYLQNGPSVVSGLSTQELFPEKTSEGLVFGVYGLFDLCDVLIGEVCRSDMFLAEVPFDDADKESYLVNHDAVANDLLELHVVLQHVCQDPLLCAQRHSDQDCLCGLRGIHRAFATPP